MLGKKTIVTVLALTMLGGSWYAYAQGRGNGGTGNSGTGNRANDNSATGNQGNSHNGNGGARFPERYRQWSLVKGRLQGPNNPNFANGGGFRYIYANRTGRDGYGDLPFDEGTVLIDERVEATEDASGVFQEGRTLHVGVMVKNSRRCAETGGWCFNFFAGDDTTVGIPPASQKGCFNQCHASRADTDFVFSKLRVGSSSR